MRKVFGVLVVVGIAIALFAFAGTLFPEGSFLRDISDGIRDLVEAIADAIARSVRGAA
ncbi:MAG: hypothetical protein R3258_04540 [Acidimicrobiia bacterium]|nr:hypothetical protein [Acidimicrobiia bacterium]